MRYFEAAILLLVGLSVFLLGMKIMGDGLERAASKSMRNLLGKVSNNRFVGVGAGAAVTAIIHSSSSTTVMVIGFVNAGLMTLYQATNIIMGANIGTTITGLMVALESVNVSLYLQIPAFVGVFIMLASKKEKVQRIGTILAGMGIIFVGLKLMSGAVKDVSDTELYTRLFTTVKNPMLLMLIGAVITAVVQSSTAINGLIITLVVPFGETGGLDIVDGLYIILGTNVGTCLTALLASVGANTNAKRASFIHLMFNVIGTLLFMVFFALFKKEDLARFLQIFGNVKFQIAWFNFFQNLICTLAILPFVKPLVRLSEIAVRKKETKKKKDYGLQYINEHFMSSPSIAIAQIIKETVAMSDLARINFTKAMDGLLSYNSDAKDEILSNEKRLDQLSIGITNYLVNVSSMSLTNADKRLVGSLYKVISDIERIGDHAVNFVEFMEEMQKDDIKISQSGIEDLTVMYNQVIALYDLSVETFKTRNLTLLKKVNEFENEVDRMQQDFSAKRVLRLREGQILPEVSLVFYGIITNLERVADHLTNIAFSIAPLKDSAKKYKGKLKVSKNT